MKVYVDEKNRIIEYWLNKDDGTDVSKVDKVLLQLLKKQKYTVCFYKAGRENIGNNTSQLLKVNI